MLLSIVQTWPYRSISRSKSTKYVAGGSSEKNSSALPTCSLHKTLGFDDEGTIWTNWPTRLVRPGFAPTFPRSRYTQFRKAVNFNPRLSQNSRCVSPLPSNSPTTPAQCSRPRRTSRFCLLTLRVSLPLNATARRRRLNGYDSTSRHAYTEMPSFISPLDQLHEHSHTHQCPSRR